MESIHERGITHGNLKLENILIDKDGHIVLSGFGRANTKRQNIRRYQQRPTLSSDAPPHLEVCQPSPEADLDNIGDIIQELVYSSTLSGAVYGSQSTKDGLKELSPSAQDLVSRRFSSLAELKAHAFFDAM